MYEQEVKIRAGNVVLAGTVCRPKKAGVFPAVLMVQGSGALGRDENTKGQQLNISNAIALALASFGIATSTGDYMSAGR